MSGPRLSILLVEDSEEDVFFFKRALSRSGFIADLFTASDGKAALEMLQDSRLKFDVVFLDLKLPKLSGFDVLKQMVAKDGKLSFKIVILSGSAHDKDKVLAANYGVVDYVVKPITADILRNQFTQICGS